MTRSTVTATEGESQKATHLVPNFFSVNARYSEAAMSLSRHESQRHSVLRADRMSVASEAAMADAGDTRPAVVEARFYDEFLRRLGEDEAQGAEEEEEVSETPY